MVASVSSFTSTNSEIAANSSVINTKSLKKQAHTLGIDEKTLKNELTDCNHVSDKSVTNPNTNIANVNPILLTKLNNIDANVSLFLS